MAYSDHVEMHLETYLKRFPKASLEEVSSSDSESDLDVEEITGEQKYGPRANSHR